MSAVVALPKAKPAMPKTADLRERDHAAEEAEEDVRLGAMMPRISTCVSSWLIHVGGEQQRREQGDREHREAGDAIGRHLSQRHAGRPKMP